MKPMANCVQKGDSKSCPVQNDIESGSKSENVVSEGKPTRRYLVLRTPTPTFSAPLLLAPLILTPLLISLLCTMLIINDTLNTPDYGVPSKTKARAEIISEIQDISGDIRNMLSSEDTTKAMKADGEFSGMYLGQGIMHSIKIKANLETKTEPTNVINEENKDVHIQAEKKAALTLEHSVETMVTDMAQSRPKPV